MEFWIILPQPPQQLGVQIFHSVKLKVCTHYTQLALFSLLVALAVTVSMIMSVPVVPTAGQHFHILIPLIFHLV